METFGPAGAVWQEGSRPKLIGNIEMMQQKLEYFHNNPVTRGMLMIRCAGVIPVLGTTQVSRVWWML
jgi:hypothetical protein